MIRLPRLLLPFAPALFVTALAGCATHPVSIPRCAGGCSTHTEGYEWAQRGDYEDPAVCEGYGAAFTDGCRDGIEDRNQLRRGSRGI